MHIVAPRGQGRVTGALEESLTDARRVVVQQHALDEVRGGPRRRERLEPSLAGFDGPHQSTEGRVARVVGERATVAPERRAVDTPAAGVAPHDDGLVREHPREAGAPREGALAGAGGPRTEPGEAVRVDARRGVHNEAIVRVERALQPQLKGRVEGTLARVDLAPGLTTVLDVAQVGPRIAVRRGPRGAIAHKVGCAAHGERRVEVIGRSACSARLEVRVLGRVRQERGEVAAELDREPHAAHAERERARAQERREQNAGGAGAKFRQPEHASA